MRYPVYKIFTRLQTFYFYPCAIMEQLIQFQFRKYCLSQCDSRNSQSSACDSVGGERKIQTEFVKLFEYVFLYKILKISNYK